ncbi:hypothetical protein WICPIJ_007448 [Wickerhamomyces pijperi]|uniref:Mediator of RNA polymerase II transcription subunit 21 n=1 Tax=Wickerhamomyces pijperi TaxID=599730 RepID=A0A9P8TJY0_WICPI|nr:hypothetical protein WICPIJ_007448 [Wickerhamomyces pijperi]
MSDRLTQLQICLDQLLNQFVSMLNYVDSSHDLSATNPTETKLSDPMRPVIPTSSEFQSSIYELSTDLILKTRQVLTLIESLPGAGVSKEEQVEKIERLQKELNSLEEKKVQAVRSKDELLSFVNLIIEEFTSDLI